MTYMVIAWETNWSGTNIDPNGYVDSSLKSAAFHCSTSKSRGYWSQWLKHLFWGGGSNAVQHGLIICETQPAIYRKLQSAVSENRQPKDLIIDSLIVIVHIFSWTLLFWRCTPFSDTAIWALSSCSSPFCWKARAILWENGSSRWLGVWLVVHSIAWIITIPSGND